MVFRVGRVCLNIKGWYWILTGLPKEVKCRWNVCSLSCEKHGVSVWNCCEGRETDTKHFLQPCSGSSLVKSLHHIDGSTKLHLLNKINIKTPLRLLVQNKFMDEDYITESFLISTVKARLSWLFNKIGLWPRAIIKNHLYISGAVTWHVPLPYASPTSSKLQMSAGTPQKTCWSLVLFM